MPSDPGISKRFAPLSARCSVRIPQRTRGYLAIIVAAVLFGVWPSLSKLVVNEVHPFVISFLIQLIPAVALLLSLRRLRVARSDWRLLALSGGVGAVVVAIASVYGR